MLFTLLQISKIYKCLARVHDKFIIVIASEEGDETAKENFFHDVQIFVK